MTSPANFVVAYMTDGLRERIRDGTLLRDMSNIASEFEWSRLILSIPSVLSSSRSWLYWPSKLVNHRPTRAMCLPLKIDATDTVLAVAYCNIFRTNEMSYLEVSSTISSVAVLFPPETECSIGSRIVVCSKFPPEIYHLTISDALQDSRYLGQSIELYGDCSNHPFFPIRKLPDEDDFQTTKLAPYFSFNFVDGNLEHIKGRPIIEDNDVVSISRSKYITPRHNVLRLIKNGSCVRTVAPLGWSRFAVSAGYDDYALGETVHVYGKASKNEELAVVHRGGDWRYLCLLRFSNVFGNGPAIQTADLKVGHPLSLIWWSRIGLRSAVATVSGSHNVSGLPLISLDLRNDSSNIRGALAFDQSNQLVGIVMFDFIYPFDHWLRPFPERYFSLAYLVPIKSILDDLSVIVDL